MRKLQDHMSVNEPRKLVRVGLEVIEETGLGFLKINSRALSAPMLEAIKNGEAGDLPDTFGHGVSFCDYDIIRTAPFHWQVVGQEQAVEALRQRLAPTIDGQAALATSLTHGRTPFRISGDRALEFMSCLVAIDLHEQSFKTGQVAITRMEETGVVIQCLKAGDGFRLVVDQSFSHYAWSLFEYNLKGFSRVN